MTAPTTVPNLTASVDAGGTLTLSDGHWRWTLPGQPIAQSPDPPPDPAPGRVWDPRLDRRGVRLTPAPVSPGRRYWQLIRATYRDRTESQGKHHIYVDVLDEQGVRIVGARLCVSWSGGSHTTLTESKPGEDAAANFPMFAAGWGYRVSMRDLPSDEVAGLGLGDIGSEHMAEHVAYHLVFQRTLAVSRPPATAT